MEYLAAMRKEIVVLGCGNILFGDDGFGSSVVERLETCGLLPENVSVIDAGTSVREILFDLILSEERPRKVIVIDAVDAKRRPGEIFRIDLEELPKNRIDDLTLHEMPTSSLLKELKDLCHVEVDIVAGQAESIPEAVRPGLSDVLSKSVPIAVDEVLKLCHEPNLQPQDGNGSGELLGSRVGSIERSGSNGVSLRPNTAGGSSEIREI